MKEVWKFPIYPDEYPVIQMPKGAQPLSVGMQGANAFIWALVDPTAPSVRHAFRLAGTGHPIAEQDSENYIGTFLMHSDTLVWHVFDIGEDAK